MNKDVKLNCPMCNEKFTTTRRDKIWCSTDCSNNFRSVKKSIDNNHNKQEMMSKEGLYYDFDLNKFFIKSLMPKN